MRRNWHQILVQGRGSMEEMMSRKEVVIAKCRVTWDGYMTFQKSIVFAMQHQPLGWYPSAPPSPAALKFYRLVQEALTALGLHGQLRLYSTRETPADRYHGADFIMTFKGTVVTVDIGLRERRNRKAAFCCGVEEVDEDDAFLTIGYRIASLFARGAVQLAY